jgi:uncharacterized protein (DUF1015 family)
MVEDFLNGLGLDIRSILLPKQGTDMRKWSVVACDQYTSEPEYWHKVNDFVGDCPSTLRLIFPEVYLDRETADEKQLRISNINHAMCDYLDKGTFHEIKDSMIYVERTTRSGKVRKGLICAVDLDSYDYSKGSDSLIRATEGTILDRLPPRIRIREKACLELPHIMLLIDDPEARIIEPLSLYKGKMDKLYSFDLMMDSGHLEGYRVHDEIQLQKIYQGLMFLKSAETFSKKYSVDPITSPLLFAAGDGNHSLATAKSCWDQLKASLSEAERKTHPARFALVELVNVHDNGLDFEPIHRLLFHVDCSDLLSAYCKYYTEKGIQCGYEYVTHSKEIPANAQSRHIIPFVHGDQTGYLWAEKPCFNLDVATLQNFLDSYRKDNPAVDIDYVHGDDVIERLGRQDNNMGFILSPMDKSDLFKTVILDGALPRKTFSMGEAEDKRFYLECRSLR